MRQHWWKLLSVAILVYALLAGLLVPLKPNLVRVSPSAAMLGQTQSFELLGYNTRFGEDRGGTRAWLNVSLGDSLYSLAAETVTVTDDRRATATFSVSGLPAEHGQRLPIACQ